MTTVFLPAGRLRAAPSIAHPGALSHARQPLDSAFLLKGDSGRHTFDGDGRFEYLCLPHRHQPPVREAGASVE